MTEDRHNLVEIGKRCKEVIEEFGGKMGRERTALTLGD